MKDTVNTENSEIPKEYLCPIALGLMEDPVVTEDGHTFDRTSIQNWFEKGNKTNPLTGKEMQTKRLTPNRNLKALIKFYKEEKKEDINIVNSYEKRTETAQTDGQNNVNCMLKNFEKSYEQFMNENRWIKQMEKDLSQLPLTEKKLIDGQYQGEIENDQCHGIGKMSYSNGDQYFGQWKNNKHHGFGIKTQCQSELHYEGGFFNGEFFGLGVISFRGEVLYQGQWKKNKRNGFGISEDKIKKLTYKGIWENDVKHGTGLEINFYGGQFEGFWKKGQKDGKGLRKKLSGRTIEQFWKKGRQLTDEEIQKQRQKCADCSIM